MRVSSGEDNRDKAILGAESQERITTENIPHSRTSGLCSNCASLTKRATLETSVGGSILIGFKNNRNGHN